MTTHMTEFERGRAAGLAEAVKVFKAWSGMETLDQMRCVYPGDPDGTMTEELGRLQKYIASIHALSCLPADNVLVPRDILEKLASRQISLPPEFTQALHNNIEELYCDDTLKKDAP